VRVRAIPVPDAKGRVKALGEVIAAPELELGRPLAQRTKKPPTRP
jgi:hypothetical protein